MYAQGKSLGLAMQNKLNWFENQFWLTVDSGPPKLLINPNTTALDTLVADIGVKAAYNVPPGPVVYHNISGLPDGEHTAILAKRNEQDEVRHSHFRIATFC